MSVTWITMEKNALNHRNCRECLVPLFCKLSYIGKGVFEEGKRRRKHSSSSSIRNLPPSPFPPFFIEFPSFLSLIFISLDLGCEIGKKSEVNFLSFGSSYFPPKEHLDRKRSDSTVFSR